jgi:hypothetical protein
MSAAARQREGPCLPGLSQLCIGGPLQVNQMSYLIYFLCFLAIPIMIFACAVGLAFRGQVLSGALIGLCALGFLALS